MSKDKTATLEALKRLADYLEKDITPDSIALELRRSAYLLNQLHPTDDLMYGEDIKRANFYLHDLAEELDPFFNKKEPFI